jgi:hypothetical protein
MDRMDVIGLPWLISALLTGAQMKLPGIFSSKGMSGY